MVLNNRHRFGLRRLLLNNRILNLGRVGNLTLLLLHWLNSLRQRVRHLSLRRLCNRLLPLLNWLILQIPRQAQRDVIREGQKESLDIFHSLLGVCSRHHRVLLERNVRLHEPRVLAQHLGAAVQVVLKLVRLDHGPAVAAKRHQCRGRASHLDIIRLHN